MSLSLRPALPRGVRRLCPPLVGLSVSLTGTKPIAGFVHLKKWSRGPGGHREGARSRVGGGSEWHPCHSAAWDRMVPWTIIPLPGTSLHLRQSGCSLLIADSTSFGSTAAPHRMVGVGLGQGSPILLSLPPALEPHCQVQRSQKVPRGMPALAVKTLGQR